MKKTLALFLFGILFLACSKSEEDEIAPVLPAKVSLLTKSYWKNLTTGELNTGTTYSYDDKKRLIAVGGSFQTYTFSYEAGKITYIWKFTDPTKPTYKWVYFYNEKGITKMEGYTNDVFDEIRTFKNRTDGGKEIVYTSPQGYFYNTKYIRFSATGNIERVAVDLVDPNEKDYEFVFEDFDTNKRYVDSPYWRVIHYLSTEFNIPGWSPPNNPRKYRKSYTATNTIAEHERYEYQYNKYGQVTEVKTFDLLDKGKHVFTRVYEYQEF